MKSERQREAAQYRGEGAEQAQKIRADADRERIVILAEAQKQAQILRGEGDAESIRIYADAFGQDKEFFAFYRSLQAYRDALAGSDTTFVLSPDSDFFRFFGRERRGAGRSAGAEAADDRGGGAPCRISATALALVLVIEGIALRAVPRRR